MKILVIVPSYKPAYTYGGPIRSIATLCEGLVAQGHLVYVYTTTANGKVELNVEPDKPQLVDGVQVTYFQRWTKGHSHFSPGLLRSLRKNCASFDVIHIQSWWNMVAVLSALICKRKGIKPVISPRGSLTKYTFTQSRQLTKKMLHNLLAKRLLEYSMIHSTSAREDKEISEFINNKIRYIVPNMLNMPDTISGNHQETPFLKIIFVGRIDPAKNLEKTLRILSTKLSFPFQLIIIGDGDRDYVEKMKQITKNAEHIQWRGMIDGEEKFKLMAESDLLILPSFTENYGNVVFESLSQGTPVLVSTNVGAKDYITKNNLGWVVEDNEKEWINILETIWTQQQKRNDIRERAPVCIVRDFNIEAQVNSYINMYQDLVKLNHKNPKVA